MDFLKVFAVLSAHSGLKYIDILFLTQSILFISNNESTSHLDHGYISRYISVRQWNIENNRSAE